MGKTEEERGHALFARLFSGAEGGGGRETKRKKRRLWNVEKKVFHVVSVDSVSLLSLCFLGPICLESFDDCFFYSELYRINMVVPTFLC